MSVCVHVFASAYSKSFTFHGAFNGEKITKVFDAAAAVYALALLVCVCLCVPSALVVVRKALVVQLVQTIAHSLLHKCN